MTKQKKQDAITVVTDKIIESLEKGVPPWRKTWKAGSALPISLQTKRAYRGINLAILMLSGYSSPYWVTFKQAKKLGGSVNKGERSTPVIFWRMWEYKTTDPETGEPLKKTRPVARYYRVFNVEQCTFPEGVIPEVKKDEEREFTPIEAAQRTADDYVDRSGVTLTHNEAVAYFQQSGDRVNMPKPDLFESSEAYYQTLFHELIHSTGSPLRLKRFDQDTDPMPFGSQDYSKEELVAEIGGSFINAMLGLEQERTIENVAAYCQSWLKKLKDDRRQIVTAAARASKAVDLILGDVEEQAVAA